MIDKMGQQAITGPGQQGMIQGQQGRRAIGMGEQEGQGG